MASLADYGLSEAAQVGIEASRFEEETLYPHPLEAKVYDVADYGITPSGSENSSAMASLLATLAQVSGPKVIHFPAGTYLFSTPFSLVNQKDLSLVGEDTLLSFTSWAGYLKATSSSNLHVEGLRFDMTPSPTIAGTIASVSETDTTATIALAIPDEFDLTNLLYTAWENGQKSCSYMECYYDGASQAFVPKLDGNLFYNSPSSSANKGIASLSYDAGNRQLSIVLNKSFPYDAYQTPSIGTAVSFAYTMYDNHGFYFRGCENVYFEHVSVYTSGGMGFRIDGGKNFYLNHFSFAPKEGSSRIMTATADIIHSACQEGDLLISNSTLSSSHDDALNIKSFYGRISSVSNALKEIRVDQTQSEVSLAFAAGDKIDVYDPSSMALVDSFLVQSASGAGTSYDLVLDHRPSLLSEGLLVGNDTKSVHFVLDNCLIENKRNRGLLLQSRRSAVKNCTFRNVIMGGIMVFSVGDQFKEAIVPEDITITSCKFLNCVSPLSTFAYGTSGPSSTPVGLIKNVTLTNNFFAMGSGKAISLSSLANSKATNNLVLWPTFTGDSLTLFRDDGLEISDNTACYPSPTSVSDFLVETKESSNISLARNQVKGV